MSAVARALVALALFTACGCSESPQEPTQVLVVIDAEPGVRAQAAQMRLEVRGGRAPEPVYELTLSAAREELVLPYVLALVPKDGDADRRFEVVVTVVDADGAFVAQVRALGGYVPHRRLLLRLLLEDSCARVRCEAEQTCSSGRCESAVIEPGSLPSGDGSDLPDAAVIAAGEPERDGGSDGGAGGNGGTGPRAGDGASGASGASGAGTSGAGAGGASGAGSGGTGQAGTAGMSGECDDGDERLCGSNVGACDSGLQICAGGEWSACMGATSGGDETCDGEDDDCDGSADEAAPCDADDLANTAVAVCLFGTCRAALCAPAFGDCNTSRTDGCEQTLTTSEHCGGCGVPCAIANASESCASGSCLVTACDADWADCDENGTSCETPLGTVDDCASCGDACAFANATASCVDGGSGRSCQFEACISSRYADCDANTATGCEEDLTASATDCGACDNDCTTRDNVASARCDGGACVFDCEPGTVDCDGAPENGCESDLTCNHCFATGASNFAADEHAYTINALFDCGGTHTFDSTTQTWNTGCCGTCPSATAPIAQTTAGGPPVVIVRAASLNVASGTTVRVVGQYPVIFAVRGDATVAGTIDASANGSTPGAGGNWTCGTSAGVDASSSNFAWYGGCGGGGGGFGTAGGFGGQGQYDSPGGPGIARGSAALTPLVGGCGGGRGGGCSAASVGAGGGAIQLSVAGTLTVAGTIRANGGIGPAGCNSGGGSGGGSGGAILLEATVLDVGSATLLANGGAGGPGGNGPAGGAGSTSAASAGGTGLDSQNDGGSGGGGGYGRIFTRVCPGP